MAYGLIDIGAGASNRASATSVTGRTYIDYTNPANLTGTLTSFEVWANTNLGGFIIGTFSGSGTSWNDRDYESIGAVTSGSKQTYTGKNCDVSANDCIGAYWDSGNMERDTTGGSGQGYITGNQFGSGAQTYTNSTGYRFSFYATGAEPPGAPSEVTATENLTNKVTVSFRAGLGGFNGHTVYRDGSDISGVIDSDNGTGIPITITDGGLETWTSSSVLTNWSTYQFGGSGGALARESTIKQVGSYSAKLTHGNNAIQITSAAINVVAYRGKDITLGGWCKTANTLNDWDVALYAQTDTAQTPVWLYPITNDWEYLLGTFTVAVDVTTIQISCHVALAADAPAYFDAISLIEGTAEWDGANGLRIPLYTYDDTTADAPVITPGSAVASDGTYSDKVALSISGNSIANGTQYTYTVKAINSTVYGAASTSDTGYRLAGTLAYQWQKSAADSDASYSDIDGATTATYNDTGAPANESGTTTGRYYKCKLDSTGFAQATSTAERGYRAKHRTFITHI